MIDFIVDIFSYTFLSRAVITGLLISLCAALLGVSLVLKRYSMVGDGLSHVGFGALSIAVALNAAPLAVAIPVVIVAAFFLLRISSESKINGEAAVALISTGSLAIGVMTVSFSSGMNIDVYNYMFGSILALGRTDVVLSVVLCFIVLILYIVLYNRIFSVTFDEVFAKAVGVRSGFYNSLLAVLTALLIVLGMRLMGAMLISALIIFPPLSSIKVFKSFKGVVISSAISSVVCFFFGVAVSYIFSAPTGASVVCVNIAAFFLYSLASLLLRMKKK